MYWDHMNGWGWMAMGFWGLIWLGLLGVVVWLAAQWVRGGTRDTPARSAREIVDERLALGEIDVDEHRRLRDELERRTPASV